MAINYQNAAVIIICIGMVFLQAGGALAEINNDITYNDPSSDIQKFDDEGNFEPASGHKNIDISRLSSSVTTLKQNLVFELMVNGIISNSDNISYSITVSEDESVVYLINYQNGLCTGTQIDDSESESENDILLTSGAGTNTLKITLPLNNLGELSSYDIAGMALEIIDDSNDNLMYYDMIPDNSFPLFEGPGEPENDMVFITEPTPGGTVIKKYLIKGTTNKDKYNVRSVEVQIDTNLETGWTSAKTDDGWQTWSFEWDASVMSDGRHFIFARAFDGELYFIDLIEVYVDRTQADSPEVLNQLILHEGDEYHYEIKPNAKALEFLDITYFAGDLAMSVIDTRYVEYNEEYYVIDISGSQVIDYKEVTYNIYIAGEIHLRASDLAAISEDLEYRVTEQDTMKAQDNYYSVVSHEPPLASYAFPLTVTKKWQSSSKSSIGFDTGNMLIIDEQTSNMISECLRYESTIVPAGTFESFVIYQTSSKSVEIINESFAKVLLTDLNSSHKIEYLSEKIGYISKIEHYNNNRELLYSLELTSYEYDGDDFEPVDEPTGDEEDSTDFPTMIIIDILLVITLIIIIVLMRIDSRRHEKLILEKIEAQKRSPAVSRPFKPSQKQMKITCPNCNSILKIVSSGKKTKIKCPRCGTEGDVES